MPGTAGLLAAIAERSDASLGTIYPGGTFQIVSNSLANPTVVTTLAPHGLATGDTVFFTASTTSVPALTAAPQQVVTVLTPTTFSVPVNCTTGGTAGAYDVAILSIPVAPVPTVNCGSAHGLRTGDTVTITGSGSTPSLDGVQVVVVTSPTQFQVPAVAAITVAGSTTTAHYTKTTFYSDVFDRGARSGDAGIVLTSVIGTAPVTTAVDMQGSIDGINWYDIGYSTMAAPATALYAQLTITTAVATVYRLLGAAITGSNPWRYFRLKFSASTNIIVSATLRQAAN